VANYSVVFKASAQKELESLNEDLIGRIFPRIEALLENPRPSGCRKLRGYKDLWRVRIGDYRLVYSINDDQKIVEILRIRHRKDVYEF
jgi:mRNA interferase RelE/StbE